MPRPRQVRDRSLDGDVDVNRAGGGSREQVLAMDARFVAAMERALAGGEAEMAEWLNGADEAERK